MLDPFWNCFTNKISLIVPYIRGWTYRKWQRILFSADACFISHNHDRITCIYRFVDKGSSSSVFSRVNRFNQGNGMMLAAISYYRGIFNAPGVKRKCVLLTDRGSYFSSTMIRIIQYVCNVTMECLKQNNMHILSKICI